jgi:hypothetical protein
MIGSHTIKQGTGKSQIPGLNKIKLTALKYHNNEDICDNDGGYDDK